MVSEGRREADVRSRYAVPEGVALEVTRRGVLAWTSGCGEVVGRVAEAPDALPEAPARGRAPLYRLEAADGRRLLVREYRKGGFFRSLRGRRFRGPWRPLRELVLHRRLLGGGVPVPEAVGAVVLTSASGWRGFLLTEERVGAVDLGRWLAGPRAGGAEVLQAAGRAVRDLHDAGVAHADLHPKNLLLVPEGGVLVIDLDRARVTERPISDAARLGNLQRLGRALVKARLKGLQVEEADALPFLCGYAGDEEAAAGWLRRLRARLGASLRWHRIWWRLTGQVRPRSTGGPA